VSQVYFSIVLPFGRGSKHIIERHLPQFVKKGISKEVLPNFILDVVAYGSIVGYQGKDRPIFAHVYNGKSYLIAVSIGDNGFIVGANPKSKLSEKEKLEK